MRHAVLATLAYYDVLDYPLRAEEVYNYLIKTGPDQFAIPAPLDVRRILDQLVLERVVDFTDGYYFLSSHDYLLPLRLKKAAITNKKLQRARHIVWWFKFFPYVLAVFASGSLGLGNCDELSDLDVLIVAKYGRIWTARFIITVWLSLFGLRRLPHQKIAPNQMCLNHYITDQSLTIPFHGLYNAQTYLHLKLLFISNLKIVSDFYKNNAWLADYLATINQPTFDQSGYQLHYAPIKRDWFSRVIVVASEVLLNTKLGDWLEILVKNYQIRRIKANPLTNHPVGHVVYDDFQLAFHPDSPELTVMRKYEQLLTELKV